MVVVGFMLFVGFIVMLLEHPILPPMFTPKVVPGEEVEAIAKIDNVIDVIRHAPTHQRARSSLAKACVLSDQAGSLIYSTRAKQAFVDRIHKLANEEEVKGNPWKAAEILVQCLPFAANQEAVHSAIERLQGGSGMSGGDIF